MHVAAFLPNWVGDVVMATPALRALREQLQPTRLVAVRRPYVAGVVDDAPWFDDVIPAIRSVRLLGRRLRDEGIDVAVLFVNSFRVAMAAWLGGCRRRIGFAHSWREWLLTDTLSMTRGPDGKRVPTPVLLDYNRLACTAGCTDPGHDLQLFTSADDEAMTDVIWQRLNLRSPTVLLNPGAAFGASKHWPEASFAHLARRLVDERGASVLVLGGPAESDSARRIASTAGRSGVVALADAGMPLSLGLSKALVRRADLLVTTDSGPRHFAHAFGRPVVTLFGPTHIAWTETFHSAAIHLQKPLPCGPCQKRVCPLGHHECMKELSPDDVFSASVRLLHRANNEGVRRVG